MTNSVTPRVRPLGAPVARPELERVLVELVRALPRHNQQFLEPSRLPAAEAQHFLRQVLPQVDAALRASAFDRLLGALVENRHNLAHAGAIESFVLRHAEERLGTWQKLLEAQPDGERAETLLRQLRRLGQMPLPLAQQAQLRAVAQAAQAAIAANLTAPLTDSVARGQRLGELLALSPLTKVRRAILGGKRTGPRYGQLSAGLDASGSKLRGILGPSEARRGRYSKIKPLLLDDGTQCVDKVVKVEADRGNPEERLDAASYARGHAAMAMAESPLVPRGSFYDDKGDLHDVMARYDGDLVHLMQVNDNRVPHFGVALAVGEEVLLRLSKLSAKGWGHFDVKPDNVLWRRDGSMALADYDTAAPSDALPADALLGSRGFTAPEMLLLRGNITPAADLFSLGVLFAKLIAPLELSEVPTYFDAAHADFLDPTFMELMREPVEEALADYNAYQAARRGAASLTPAQQALAAPYEALRQALATATDDAFASLVIDRLLNPAPDARGSAAALLAELRARYPADHVAHDGYAALLQESAQACSYTLGMDATFRDMQSYRDGLRRSDMLPPPLPNLDATIKL